MNGDPRVEAAWDVHDQSGPNMTAILAAADAADREAGIHRILVDDATVELIARELWKRRALGTLHPEYKWESLTQDLRQALLQDARAILSALIGVWR